MFGLTKRGQRWKADQQAAELIAVLTKTALQEAKTDADELARLRAENTELRRLLRCFVNNAELTTRRQ